MKSLQFSIIILLLTIISQSVSGQTRIIQELSEGWKFAKGENKGAWQVNFDDSHWQNVVVPHDWAIEGPFNRDGDPNTGKLPWKDEGWYRIRLNIPSAWSGKQIYLLFDGVMAFPEVYINGELAGRWDYGYNSFYLNVTRLIKSGSENVVAVHADTRKHDSRWYPGAGIYRKVSLIAVNPIHVDIWGTYITTPVVKPNYADVLIATTVNNCGAGTEEVVLRHVIKNQSGSVVAEKEAKGIIAPGKNRIIETTVTLTDPHRWDINDPHLYSVETKVINNDKEVDNYVSTFGVRTIRFTADDGFYLNDRRVQLKGVCLHHDLGALGAAFNLRALERELEIMKEMGVNAIRSSHNVPAPELPWLCDRMGLLLFNEAFDKYDAKADITDTTDFENFAHRNIRNFVVRDRNHPSVFIWSVGNEIGDVQRNVNNGFQRLHTMVNYVRKYDPTRPVTLVCDNEQSASLRHFDYYDVHSWNYGRRYKLARQMEPNKAVIISESASTVSTRGFFELPLPEKKTDFTKSLQVSSYDLNAPEWAEIPDDDFMWQQEEPYVAGEFVWTGFDYLGEPTPYNSFFTRILGLTAADASRSSYFGIVDLAGIPKDRYWLYRSYWKTDANTVHIVPHWNWENMEGKNIPVFVYTNGDCAELFLNGKSLGKKCKNPKSENSVERFRLIWKDVIYEPGELRAVAYKEGVKIGEAVVKTAGKPYQLRLTPDRTVIKSDGKDLSFILVEALDRNGNPCPLANNNFEIKVKGSGKFIGVDNGNPQSLTSFHSTKYDLFYGKAMIIVGASKTKGEITVEVISDGLKPAITRITTQN
ncbi:MAG TPA: glycoside hydrolase family 2 TIM barrel-domain containing protein [Bacteroidales bacterium]|nr:glycoside hydrolase family 2 TIM barrel-domain containing protein [Bacteroidales bacterium]HOK73911.1 glycoside hydrolase family 2 TIM barrel-domain containing protein [Bacteroidales bacterium]HOM39578.1 glycoside hydrolase family 2 TIM barrel-domain containing protein [Bacteroidales bacterium]HOU29740.1 glycoside hydrolase family 2 TIM barrel-domain containing protein [Bacteroidales bacterium]HPP91960.1 glycoside hydrolase family 2 TIM barrel-domain containing protein [Bacteroidales bacteri